MSGAIAKIVYGHDALCPKCGSNWAKKDDHSRGMSKRSIIGNAPVMRADETIVKARGKAKLIGFAPDAASLRRVWH